MDAYEFGGFISLQQDCDRWGRRGARSDVSTDPWQMYLHSGTSRCFQQRCDDDASVRTLLYVTYSNTTFFHPSTFTTIIIIMIIVIVIIIIVGEDCKLNQNYFFVLRPPCRSQEWTSALASVSSCGASFRSK